MPAVQQISSIMNFSYFPYGNAEEHKKSDGSWSFNCQHGANECKANIIMGCAMHYHANYTEYMPFVECMESSLRPVAAGEKCATSAGWSDWKDIQTCANGKEGNALMHLIAVATDSLVPAHKWTPWVVLNGKYLNNLKLDLPLIRLVCKAYTGSNKPAACNSEPMSHKVCMKEPIV